jgi:flagella basal body P-ring formation protein FlgA
VAFWTGLLGGSPALALTMELQPEAMVAGSQVRLGEVALITGEPAEESLIGAVAAAVLGQAPRPGQVRVFTQGQVAVRLRQAGLHPEQVGLTGSESVTVRRPGRTLGQEEAEGLYRGEVARLLGVAEDRVTISLVNWVEPVVPEGELRLRILGEVAQVARAAATGTLTGPVAVAVNGEPQATLRPRAVVAVKVPAVVAREGLARGSVIRPGQVEVTEIDLSRLPEGALRQLAEAEGRQATRLVPVGVPLSGRDVMAPVVVRRGERVLLKLERGGLTLTAQGVALEDGGVGETVKVQNVQSNRTIEGVVQGTGEVAVAPV